MGSGGGAAALFTEQESGVKGSGDAVLSPLRAGFRKVARNKVCAGQSAAAAGESVLRAPGVVAAEGAFSPVRHFQGPAGPAGIWDCRTDGARRRFALRKSRCVVRSEPFLAVSQGEAISVRPAAKKARQEGPQWSVTPVSSSSGYNWSCAP